MTPRPSIARLADCAPIAGQGVTALKEFFPLGFDNRMGEIWSKATAISCEGWPFYKVQFPDGTYDVIDVNRIRGWRK